MDKLLLGDSNQLLKEIPNESVDLTISDPPYGLDYRSNRQRVDRKESVEHNQSIVVRPHYFSKIENDTPDSDLTWVKECYRVLKDGSAIYIFTHWKRWSFMENAVQGVGFEVKSMIVLNKSNHGMGNLKQYAPKHELLLFATKGKHELTFPSGRQPDIWNVPVIFSGSRRLHPNQKPIDWLLPALLNSSKKGDWVLDPFMGSGSTGVACVRSNRRFIGMEKDENYYNTAVKRITEENNVVKSEIFSD